MFLRSVLIKSAIPSSRGFEWPSSMKMKQIIYIKNVRIPINIHKEARMMFETGTFRKKHDKI